MVLAYENKTNNEEDLEYESNEEEDFEKQYVESQMGPNFNNISYNDNDNDNDKQEKENNQEEENGLRSEYDEYDFSEDNEEDNDKDSGENNQEEHYRDKKQELEGDLEIMADSNIKQEHSDIKENEENNNQHRSDYSLIAEKRQNDEQYCDNMTKKVKTKEIIDPFDDDELIEYVDDSNEDSDDEHNNNNNNNNNSNNNNNTNNSDNDYNYKANKWVLDDEFKDSSKSENDHVESVVNINDDNMFDFPIYLDFCELFSTSKVDTLENKWLDNKIKVNFDFIKLYQSRYKEDEIYSEIDILYDNLKDCIDLTFNEILFKIKEVLINSNQENNIEEIDIHLTFSDLINLSISSDSILSESLTLREVLKIYEKLKIQSPNADLYKFLSIKVSITRNILGQLRILDQASLNGYRLENLNNIISNKRLYEEICDNEGKDKIDDDGTSDENKKIKFE